MARGKKGKFSILRIDRDISSALKDLGGKPPKRSVKKPKRPGKSIQKKLGPRQSRPLKKPPAKISRPRPLKKTAMISRPRPARLLPRPPEKKIRPPKPAKPGAKILEIPEPLVKVIASSGKPRPGLILEKKRMKPPPKPGIRVAVALPEKAAGAGGPNIETSPDRLYRMVQARGKLPLQEAAREFSLEERKVEGWARILEEHNLIRMHYPAFGKATLYSLDFDGKRGKKPSPKQEY